MVDIYFFKHKLNDGNDFYLRIDHSKKISFIIIEENHIFTALDLLTVLKDGKVTLGIDVKTIDMKDFPVLNIEKNPITHSNFVTINKDLKYFDDISVIYVANEEFSYKDDILNIKYYSKDSDRHSEKEELKFTIDIDKGIYSFNDNHFFYADKNIFTKYKITKL